MIEVYQLSFEEGMVVFQMTRYFPKEERYSLTNQIQRSPPPVSGNVVEAWRKRRYQKAIIAILSDAEGEVAEA